MLSVVIFVFWPEDESLIGACLESVKWADELVVIDNGASAKTLETVRKYHAKIVKESSSDFSLRHNLGKEKASGDWLLYLDADERVSKKLAAEIKNVLVDPKFAAYQITRRNVILGNFARFGDRYPDMVTRLFKNDKLLSWEGEIHESSKVTGPIGRLSEPLYHLTHRDIYSMLRKTINFSEHEAALRLAAHHPPVVWWRLLRVFITEFITRIITYQGWRDGTEGWIDGIFQSFSLFVVYVRLWELQRKSSLEETYKEIDRKISSGDI